MPGGKDVQVTNQNKFQFVDLWYMCMLFSIQTQTSNKVKRSLDTIRKGMSKVIPEQLLNVFEPYQFEMILYGVPFIDLKEWRENSTYKQPYSENHQVIKWFWKCMETFDQDQLAHILHFCTGSSRTPIHGFKYFFLLKQKIRKQSWKLLKIFNRKRTIYKNKSIPKRSYLFQQIITSRLS